MKADIDPLHSLGGPIGGLFADHLSWRLAFWVQVSVEDSNCTWTDHLASDTSVCDRFARRLLQDQVSYATNSQSDR